MRHAGGERRLLQRAGITEVDWLLRQGHSRSVPRELVSRKGRDISDAAAGPE